MIFDKILINIICSSVDYISRRTQNRNPEYESSRDRSDKADFPASIGSNSSKLAENSQFIITWVMISCQHQQRDQHAACVCMFLLSSIFLLSNH